MYKKTLYMVKPLLVLKGTNYISKYNFIGKFIWKVFFL